VNAWSNALNNRVTQASLVSLMLDYLPESVQTGWESWVIRVVFVVVLGVLNIIGVKWVSIASSGMLVLVFVPFVSKRTRAC
jgi:hypothetical protein